MNNVNSNENENEEEQKGNSIWVLAFLVAFTNLTNYTLFFQSSYSYSWKFNFQRKFENFSGNLFSFCFRLNIQIADRMDESEKKLFSNLIYVYSNIYGPKSKSNAWKSNP